MVTIIETKGLCCQSGKNYLLNHVDWKVKKGEHWLVFGLNGCGKTTLLSVIAGFRAVSDGIVKLFGQPYTKENILNVRKKIGWVSSSFFDKYYTKESSLNIVLSGLFGTLGIDYAIQDEDVVRAKQLLQKLHVGDKIHTPFSLMSKGERQNVLLARALISQPELLVLDEPGTGLDVYAREQMLELVRTVAEKTDVTIVYVTHYPEEIQTDIFKKCLTLKKGRVFAQGDLVDVMNNQTISALLEIPVHVIQRNNVLGIEMKGLPTVEVDKCLNWEVR